ncbi:MAG: SH3 domain-containing protein [Anaerolineae bacterium]|nr:SH3 domain-containing protein [Anaerolineae bacterium]
MRLRYLPLLFTLSLMLGGITIFSARSSLAQENTCSTVVEAALAAVGTNCSDLSRNNACYGYNNVAATFTETVAEDFFTQPSDVAGLATLQTIESAPLDTAINQWGVAVLSVQANIPNTLPGQAVKFILMGDAAVTNAVPPEEALQTGGEPVNLTILVAANIRSRPTTNSNVVGSVQSGATLPADAISTDGEWLRVVFNEINVGWINRQLVDNNPDITTLPVVSAESRTPMQAFYLTTSIGESQCNEAPSLLMVQGPDNLTVNLNANGVDIQLSSTAVLQLKSGNLLTIIIVSGSGRVGNVIVPAGFVVDVPLDDEGNQNGPLQNLRPLTPEELEKLVILELLPPNLLNYPINLPTPEEIQQTLAALNNGGTGGPQPGITIGGQGCEGFRITSPLDGWGVQVTTFYWDAAPGATSYRLYTSAGSVETTNLNASVDLTNLSGNTLSWSVDALRDGQVICSSGTSIPRDLSILPPICAVTSSC